ncbi:MAG: family 10 glycosylhydrolase [Armatimonadota bacterium]|nr:family 10 glycosylhydrolase [Armatimonadota bacterium]
MLFRLFALCACLLLVEIPALAINGLWVHPERVINKETADKTLDQAQRCGIDNIFVLVFHHEQAWFKTPLCAMSKSVAGDFDPLGYCIEEAHKRGIKVHAWFVNGEAENGAITSKHQDWLAQDAEGRKAAWFDFTKKEVRDFQRDLMLSAVKQYPNLDGIHFDYIRFPNMSLGYGPAADEFRKAMGIDLPTWDKFPLRLTMSANPVHAATTGKVLALFDNGLPAIIENSLGKGKVLLFNWHAESSRFLVLDNFLLAKLKLFGANSRCIRILVSEANAKRYGSAFKDAAERWLERIGFKATIAEFGKDEPQKDDILVVPNIYIWSEQDAAKLRKLVEEGMNVIWIDGPAIGLPDLMAVLGVDHPASFFADEQVIKPVVDDPAMPVNRDFKDSDVLQKQVTTWKQWRMDRITDLVRDVYQSAKRIKPSIKVTAAVFYKKASADGVLQDWQRWVREGYVDYVIPMAYVGHDELARAFDEWEKLPTWRDKVIPGLSIYTFRDQKAVAQDKEYVRQQVELCRKRGAKGIMFFCCHYISPELEPVLKSARIVGSQRRN